MSLHIALDDVHGNVLDFTTSFGVDRFKSTSRNGKHSADLLQAFGDLEEARLVVILDVGKLAN